MFLWAYSAVTVPHSPKLTDERHILGMSTRSQNDSHCPKLCRLSCSFSINTPRKYRFLAVLGPIKSPAQKFGNFQIIYWCTHADTDSCLLFQNWSKSVQDKWSKVRAVGLNRESLATCANIMMKFVWIVTTRSYTHVPRAFVTET